MKPKGLERKLKEQACMNYIRRSRQHMVCQAWSDMTPTKIMMKYMNYTMNSDNSTKGSISYKKGKDWIFLEVS